ncbi:MAG: hypothetical protein ACO1OO_05970 [Flavisolibacter sp.]
MRFLLALIAFPLVTVGQVLPANDLVLLWSNRAENNYIATVLDRKGYEFRKQEVPEIPLFDAIITYTFGMSNDSDYRQVILSIDEGKIAHLEYRTNFEYEYDRFVEYFKKYKKTRRVDPQQFADDLWIELSSLTTIIIGRSTSKNLEKGELRYRFAMMEK